MAVYLTSERDMSIVERRLLYRNSLPPISVLLSRQEEEREREEEEDCPLIELSCSPGSSSRRRKVWNFISCSPTSTQSQPLAPPSQPSPPHSPSSQPSPTHPPPPLSPADYPPPSPSFPSLPPSPHSTPLPSSPVHLPPPEMNSHATNTTLTHSPPHSPPLPPSPPTHSPPALPCPPHVPSPHSHSHVPSPHSPAHLPPIHCPPQLPPSPPPAYSPSHSPPSHSPPPHSPPPHSPPPHSPPPQSPPPHSPSPPSHSPTPTPPHSSPPPPPTSSPPHSHDFLSSHPHHHNHHTSTHNPTSSPPAPSHPHTHPAPSSPASLSPAPSPPHPSHDVNHAPEPYSSGLEDVSQHLCRHRTSSTSSNSSSSVSTSTTRSHTPLPAHDEETYRHKVLSEVYDTEKTYVKGLSLLLTTFLPALEGIVASEHQRLLFPAQLDALLEKHRYLLAQLEERLSPSCRWRGIVGDLFGKICSRATSDLIGVYSAYMKEFKTAMQLLAHYQQNVEDFQQMLASVQADRSCGGLTLGAYLLTPVQRLTRYKLLMKDLLKNTPEENPDHFFVSQSLEMLTLELFRLNQSIESCQLACSVNKAKNNDRKPRRRFSLSRRSSRSTGKLNNNILGGGGGGGGGDDGNNSPSSSSSNYSSNKFSHSKSTTHVRRHNSMVVRSVYRSEENLRPMMCPDLVNSYPYPYLPPPSHTHPQQWCHRNSAHHLSPDYSDKAASCSDLILEFEEPSEDNNTQESAIELELNTTCTSSNGASSSLPPISFMDFLSAAASSGKHRRSSMTSASSYGDGSVEAAATHAPNSNNAYNTGDPKVDDKKKRGSLKFLRKKQDKQEIPTISKHEIGYPTEFRHVRHGFYDLAKT